VQEVKEQHIQKLINLPNNQTVLKYHPLTHFRWIPPCFISETTNFFLPGFCYLCIFFPGSNIHVITISALNMTGSCNAYTVDNSCM
jgi:hypothetical protein